MTGETGKYMVERKFFKADFSIIWIVRNEKNKYFMMKNVKSKQQRAVATRERDILRHIHRNIR